ncbi:MAG: CRTAC1 family protein, partial [Gemmatimonadetes bacterium]|nr:CRTAC1 family protein [Gemmatimonadota bacterium]
YTLDMQGHDEFYENQGGERFALKSREVFPRTPWGAMCAKVFDFDNDGDFDMFVSDMHSDMSDDVPPDREKRKANMKYPPEFLRDEGMSVFGNAFYRNDGGGGYTEVSDAVGAENLWPWGFSVGDLNADGFDDVFIASSMNYPFRYGINSLLVNNSGQGFLDAEFILGVEPRRAGRTARPWFLLDCDDEANAGHEHCADRTGEFVIWAALGSRASVFFDLEGDGDLDIVTNEFNSEPMVLVSNLSEKRQIRYLSVQLRGTESNRSGIGAIVEVAAGETTCRKINDGQSGYLSQSDMPLYFGLGEAAAADRISVRWPSGNDQVLEGPFPSGQPVTITEE